MIRVPKLKNDSVASAMKKQTNRRQMPSLWKAKGRAFVPEVIKLQVAWTVIVTIKSGSSWWQQWPCLWCDLTSCLKRHPDDDKCFITSESHPSSFSLNSSVIYIQAEHGPLLQQTCDKCFRREMQHEWLSILGITKGLRKVTIFTQIAFAIYGSPVGVVSSLISIFTNLQSPDRLTETSRREMHLSADSHLWWLSST